VCVPPRGICVSRAAERVLPVESDRTSSIRAAKGAAYGSSTRTVGPSGIAAATGTGPTEVSDQPECTVPAASVGIEAAAVGADAHAQISPMKRGLSHAARPGSARVRYAWSSAPERRLSYGSAMDCR
jgi:hypothetical protein